GDVGAGLAGPPSAKGDEERARLLAGLGILGGPGMVALVGEPARTAAEVAGALPEIHVAAIDADLVQWPETERVSRLVASPGIPFVDWAMRAAAIDGRLGPAWIGEAVRVVAPRGRIVVVRAETDVVRALEAAGARVLASDDRTVVAARS